MYAAAIEMADSNEDHRIREIEITISDAFKLYLALVDKYKEINSHCEQEWNPSALILTVGQMKIEGEDIEAVKGVLNRLGESWVDNASLKKDHIAFFLEYLIPTSRVALKLTFSSELKLSDPEITASVLSMSRGSVRSGERNARPSVRLFRSPQDQALSSLEELPAENIQNALNTLVPGQSRRTFNLL